MKNTSIKLICALLLFASSHAFAQSGVVLPHGIKVPEVADLDQVVSPLEGMMVYSEQQQGLFLRKGSSWEALSAEVPSSEAHIFIEIDGESPDLYDETVSKEVHYSESKILEIDFNFGTEEGSGRVRGAATASIKFKKKLGRTSLRIQRALVMALFFKDVTFTFYVRDPATSTDIPYYKYTLKNVKFVGDRLVGPHAELGTLIQNSPTLRAKSVVEEVELIFEEMKVENLVDGTYFEYDFYGAS